MNKQENKTEWQILYTVKELIQDGYRTEQCILHTVSDTEDDAKSRLRELMRSYPNVVAHRIDEISRL